MKFVPFILKHLKRNWIGTTGTVVGMAVWIFLFCTLQTLIAAVTWNLKSSGASRLNTRHNVSLVFNMPNSYEARIAALPGVKRVAAANWFGGQRDINKPRDFFPNMAVEAENFLAMYPEYLLTNEQKQRFLGDRRGCIVGTSTAEKVHWKEGDTSQLESIIPPYRVGKPFEFVIDAIYDTDQVHYPGTNDSAMFFHYKYLDEQAKGLGRHVGVGMYRVEINDPKHAGPISNSIITPFQTPSTQTHTETEQAFRAGFISLVANLALLLNRRGVAVLFALLLDSSHTLCTSRP